MSQVPIQLPNGQASPSEYELTQSQTLSPKSAVATFDGTGAGGAFLACLSFYAQNGALVTRVFPATPVVAGDVAAVSYAPFPGGLASGGGGGSGIEFDVDNVGDWLSVETTAVTGSGDAMTFTDTAPSSNGITLTSDNGQVVLNGTGVSINSSAAGSGINLNAVETIAIIAGTSGAANGEVIIGSSATSGGRSVTLDNVESGGNGDIIIRIGNGGVFVVWGQAGSSDPIFRVDEDGALHGKTGQALTFDL